MMTDKQKENIKKAIEDITFHCFNTLYCTECDLRSFCFEHFKDTPMRSWGLDIDKLFKDE